MSRERRFGAGALAPLLLLVLASGLVLLWQVETRPHVFVETFHGRPDQPQLWRSPNWDVTIHSRDEQGEPVPMQAQHGPDCAMPPATHNVSSEPDAVFQCNDHVMTAIDATGYGVIYLTPNQVLDFTHGEARIVFDVSTARTSLRDWIDLWLTPFDDNVQLPLDNWLPDGNGEPRRAVHIRMDSFEPQGRPAVTVFKGSIVRDFQVHDLPGNTWTGYEDFLTPSATRRETFELRLSRTHLRFGMPQHHFWWIDTSIADLEWSSGVVQIGHHSYNPTKDCPAGQTCGPNTWHWGRVQLSPARPFKMLRPDVDELTQPASTAHFATAPRGAYLRFTAIGSGVEVSFDGGLTWQPAQRQATAGFEPDHWQSYWTPVPAGTTTAQLRARNWWGGPWLARNLSVWAPSLEPLAPLPLAPPVVQQLLSRWLWQ